MKKYKRLIVAMVLMATNLFLSQCIFPERRADDYHISIFTPLDGAVVGIGDTVEVVGQVIDWETDIDIPRDSHMIFFANGINIGEADVSLAPGYYTDGRSVEWGPEEPGEYYIQVISSRRGRLAISDAHRICVIDFPILSPDLSTIGGYWGSYGFNEECEIPERSPDAAPGPLTFAAIASPDPFQYFPGWWSPIYNYYYLIDGEPLPDGCSDLPSALSFRATASDPNDDIVFVKVDVSFDYTTRILSSSLILERESGTGLIPKIFSGESLGTGNFAASEINETFEIRWTAYAYDRSGDIIASVGPNTISVEPCYDAEMVPLSAPLPSEVPDLIHPAVLPCEGIQGISIRDNGVMRTTVKVPDAYGEYAATLNDLPISCLFYEAYPDTLLCDSPKPQSNTLATLIIFDDQGNEFCNEIFTVPGPSGDQPDKDKDEGCNLSVDICSAQGLSFDVNNCQCVEIQ